MLDGRAIEAENVLFTEGAASAIDLLTRAFCDPFQDRVCVCNPTFPYYERAARSNDVEVIDVPLKGEDFSELDLPAIGRAKPKLTFLCSPGNPIGSALHQDQVEALLGLDGGLVVIDEAYIDFAGSPSYARWLGRLTNLVVLRTFSKAWGLAGVRAGAVLAAPLVLRTLQTVQITYAFGSPAQAILARRLEETDSVRAQVDTLCAERERLRQSLSQIPFVKRIYPSEANFLCVEVADAAAIHAGLMQAKILVADTSAQVPNTLRISIAAPEDNDALLKALWTLA